MDNNIIVYISHIILKDPSSEGKWIELHQIIFIIYFSEYATFDSFENMCDASFDKVLSVKLRTFRNKHLITLVETQLIISI